MAFLSGVATKKTTAEAVSLVDADAVQLIHVFFAQEEFIGVKSLALPSVLSNIRRPVMETV